MATDEGNKNVLTMLFKFYCPPSKTPLEIEGIDKLSIDDQLDVMRIENINTQKTRKETTTKLYDKLPDLKESAHKRIRFKSILSSYYKSYIELETMAVQNWSKQQLSLSLYVYLLRQLQQKPVGDKEKAALIKEKKNTDSSWKFVYFTLKFCEEETFNGQSLYNFWAEVTENGTKTGGFGLKFVQKICKKYKLKFGKFAKVKKKVGVWFTDNVNRTKQTKDNTATTTTKTTTSTTNATVSTGGSGYEQKQNDAPKSVPKPVPKPVYKPPEPEPAASGSKWYWMDMVEFQWTPYPDNDQEILNQAYANRDSRVDVVSGKYRVEFDTETGAAAGNQFQNNIADPINHMVVRAIPEDGCIHGMSCSDKAK